MPASLRRRAHNGETATLDVRYDAEATRSQVRVGIRHTGVCLNRTWPLGRPLRNIATSCANDGDIATFQKPERGRSSG